MLIGEYLHGPIFNDFLNKKYLWPIAFLETVLWIVPLSWLNCFLIKKVPNLKSVGRVILSTTFWIGLSMSVFLIYHLNADPGWQLWSKANLSHAYVYGWYIPGAMMIIIFALLSLKKN